MLPTPVGLELTFVAYVDTACAKSVVGSEVADELVKHCNSVNWLCETVPDREPFRFGPGKRIWSEKALVFVVVWGRHMVVLRVSVVQPHAPCLLSKPVFQMLGGVIDLAESTVTFKGLNSKTERLHDLTTGHIAIELVKPGAQTPEVSETVLSLCRNGSEVTVDNEALRR